MLLTDSSRHSFVVSVICSSLACCTRIACAVAAIIALATSRMRSPDECNEIRDGLFRTGVPGMRCAASGLHFCGQYGAYHHAYFVAYERAVAVRVSVVRH